MKKHFLLATLFLSLFALISLSSCEKDETDKAPVITLDSPADGDEFSNGDEISIEGKVTDESLHELKIELVNASTGAVLFSEKPTVHDMTAYNFHIHYDVEGITEHTTVKLNIEVADHSSHVSTKSIELHFNP